MGILRKAASKLHIKSSSSKHSTTGHLKHDYESQPISEADAAVPKSDPNKGQGEGAVQPTANQAQVQEAQKPETSDKNKRGPARLVLEHAPKAPPWAKGLDDNTTYTMHRGDTGAMQEPAAAAQQQPFAEPAAAGSQAVPGSDYGTTTSREASTGTQASQEQRNQKAASVIPDGATKQTPAQQPSGTLVQAGTIGKGLLLLWIFATLVYIQLFNISLLGMILPFLLLGMPTGLGLSWLFFYQKGAKRKISAQLNITPGQKGLVQLTGDVPSWINFQDREKVKWLNTVLTELWPYYDKAAAAMIKETVEPLMEQYKPPGLIKKIYFKNLSFGDAPFKIENVWVEDEGEKHVLMEVALRWAGDANIAIAIELPAGGEATRMVPKISDLHIQAVGRILLAPLVGEIPGFGAAVISLRRPPQIKFKLDFGKALGSGYTAKAVRLWLDPFLRETLADLIVWPNRIVVPILPENVTGPLDDLMLRHKGVLQVWVLEAKDLHKQDIGGKADPFVQLQTRVQDLEQTEHKKNTLTPVWNERKWLMVQEPKTQPLRVEVFDWDRINAKELLTINLLKGLKDTMGAKTLMGRVAIPIERFFRQPEQDIEDWYELGRNDFASDIGTGKGHGKIKLRIKYMSLEQIYSQPRSATVGAVMVTLKKGEDLPSADPNGYSDPYVKFKLNGDSKKSTVKRFTLNPAWNEKFEWFKVPVGEVLECKLMDNDTLGEDDMLGLVEIDIAKEVASSPNGEVLKTWYLEEIKHKGPEPPPASVTMHLQWVPFDID